MKLVLIALSLLLTASAFANQAEQTCIDAAARIEDKLACLSEITFHEIKNSEVPAGARQFDIQFTQKVDHQNPQSEKFSQRLILTHFDESGPMILQTSGYSIFGARLSILATTYSANQLQVEHRFFSNSKPTNMDWSKLDIRQSADDFHAITLAFKQIYQNRWVNTGNSKGGMTSIYHRRFYPDDLDGTVANVAPLSFKLADERYSEFVSQVGGEKYRDCREKLIHMQITLLKNREVLIPLLPINGGVFDQLGGLDVAFEQSVISSQFLFWQYGNPDDTSFGCQSIPQNDSIFDMLTFLEHIDPIAHYTDSDIQTFVPYYYQAATQLGGPADLTASLTSLIKYPQANELYIPKGISHFYSNTTMQDIDRWVRNEADKIIFIYGDLDPWSAGAFPTSDTGKDVTRYYVPNGNHGSNFTILGASDKAHVVDKISTWLNKQPILQVNKTQTRDSLDQIELNALRKRH